MNEKLKEIKSDLDELCAYGCKYYDTCRRYGLQPCPQYAKILNKLIQCKGKDDED